MSPILASIIIISLIAMNGFFVALEFALIAADRSKLKALADDGKWSAKVTVGVLKKLSFHLSGAQLGITVTSLVLGFLADSLVRQFLEPLFVRFPLLDGPTMSVLVALFVATIFQLVFGELIPKNIAIAKPEVTSLALSPVAQVVNGAFKPFIIVFNGAANWIVRKIGLEPKEELSELLSLEELEHLIKTSGDSGKLPVDAQNLLTKTIRFGDKIAADALTPRVHIRAVEIGSSLEHFLDEAKEHKHSKFLVIDGDLDNVKGVVDVASAFAFTFEERSKTSVARMIKEILVVPETKELVEILKDFESFNSEMAVVIDEHGGTAGIITIEDVLEEIVGEIDDEYDEQRYLTKGVKSGTFILAGTLHPDEVEEACGFAVPEGAYETLAGFVLAEMGRIPFVGDQFVFQEWTIEILEMESLRVASLQLRKVEAKEASEVENNE